MTAVAALLLTGGASRRMGADKALLPGPGDVPLAAGLAVLLRAVADPVFECGPGRTDLPAVPDDRPGAGPLPALAGGVAALRSAGWAGGAVVVATDLPALDVTALGWLVRHPAPGSVVPVVDERPQWLCARWSAAALDAAGPLVAGGERRMAALGAAAPCHLARAGEWSSSAGPGTWADVDTPEDLAALLGRRA